MADRWRTGGADDRTRMHGKLHMTKCAGKEINLRSFLALLHVVADKSADFMKFIYFKWYSVFGIYINVITCLSFNILLFNTYVALINYRICQYNRIIISVFRKYWPRRKLRTWKHQQTCRGRRRQKVRLKKKNPGTNYKRTRVQLKIQERQILNVKYKFNRPVIGKMVWPWVRNWTRLSHPMPADSVEKFVCIKNLSYLLSSYGNRDEYVSSLCLFKLFQSSRLCYDWFPSFP